MNPHGHTIKIIPPTKFDFSGLQNGALQTLLLAQRIPCAHTEAHVLFRLHAGTTITTPASQNLTINLLADGVTEDDPLSSFTSLITSFTTPTTAITVPFYKPFGAFIGNSGQSTGHLLAVSLVAQQMNPAASLIAVVSLDLVLKGGPPPGQSVGGFRGYA